MKFEQPRILSIQSHVVSGYCGNRSATFPLQLLGFEVDVINSVQLSNHTQYKVSRGRIFDRDDFDKLYDGLKSNSLTDHYSHILSGYVADVSYIESMEKAIIEIKANRQEQGLSCLYTLDPVLGDEPGFYVPGGEKVAKAYNELLVPLADVIVPNRFEASFLSGINVVSIETALKSMNYFHQIGVKLVVLTSFQIDPNKEELTCLASYKPCCQTGSDQITSNRFYRIDIPKLDCSFTGTGDLFASLLTAWLYKTEYNIKEALEKTVSSVYKILEDTFKWSKKVADVRPPPFCYELRLVQNKSFIETLDTFLSAYEV